MRFLSFKQQLIFLSVSLFISGYLTFFPTVFISMSVYILFALSFFPSFPFSDSMPSYVRSQTGPEGLQGGGGWVKKGQILKNPKNITYTQKLGFQRLPNEFKILQVWLFSVQIRRKKCSPISCHLSCKRNRTSAWCLWFPCCCSTFFHFSNKRLESNCCSNILNSFCEKKMF
jgi:hypothetical protein